MCVCVGGGGGGGGGGSVGGGVFLFCNFYQFFTIDVIHVPSSQLVRKSMYDCPGARALSKIERCLTTHNTNTKHSMMCVYDFGNTYQDVYIIPSLAYSFVASFLQSLLVRFCSLSSLFPSPSPSSSPTSLSNSLSLLSLSLYSIYTGIYVRK